MSDQLLAVISLRVVWNEPHPVRPSVAAGAIMGGLLPLELTMWEEVPPEP